MLASGLVLFPLYAGAKVAFLAPTWTAPVEERNVIYLVPLVLAAAARWLAHRRVPLLRVAAAGVVALALLRLTPAILSLPYFEAPGFSLVAGLYQDAGLGAGAARNAEVLLLVVSVVVVAVAGLGAWGRRVAYAAAAAVLVALFAGELWASAEQRRLAAQIRDESAQPSTWLDDVAGDRPVAFVGRELRNVNGLWTLEFWNQSLRDVVVLGGFPPPPGEGLAANVTAADGAVGPDPGTPLVVTDAELVPDGTLLAQQGRWRLYETSRPLRLTEDVEGVDPDGWAGGAASYTRFRPAPGSSSRSRSAARRGRRRARAAPSPSGWARWRSAPAEARTSAASRRSATGRSAAARPGSSGFRHPAARSGPTSPSRPRSSPRASTRRRPTRARWARRSRSGSSPPARPERAAARGACGRSGRSPASARASAG